LSKGLLYGKTTASPAPNLQLCFDNVSLKKPDKLI